MSNEPKPGVLEGQTIASDLELQADVCIVGSGPGGAVAASTLARAGLKVVVLEAGGYFTKSRFRMLENEAYSMLYQEGAARSTKDLSIAMLQGKAVGGGSVVNWTTCFRTPEYVVEHWREHFGVAGINSQQLAPFFDAAEKRLNVRKGPVGLLNRNNRLLYDGCKALEWQVDTTARNVIGCAQTGFCGLGCPVDAKQSMLVTYLPDAMNEGATIISRCRVDKFEVRTGEVVAAHGTFMTADGSRPTGQRLRLRAKHFVSSASALGSPALLMRSGISDQSTMLGRRTFLHPVAVSVAFFKEPVEGYYGAPQSAASHQFSDRGKEVGFFMECAPTHPGLASTILPGHGQANRTLSEKAAHLAAHIAVHIDGFHEDVAGGTVELDSDGQPVLDYVISPRLWRALRVSHQAMARLQFAVGAQTVSTCRDPDVPMHSPRDIELLSNLPYEPNRTFVTSAHTLGGCLMSDDPKRGVVRSEDLRHHSIPNLHVIDGSVFPTGLGVNPQMSIYGLAGLVSSRLAELWA